MRLFLLSLSVLLLHACGSVSIPATKLYSLLPTVPGASSRMLPQVLRIGRFAVSPHLESDRLLVRVGRNSLESFEYHLWAAPLGEVLAGAVHAALLRSGIFADVVANDAALEADWVMDGQVLAFELIEDEQGCGVWFQMVLSLRDAKTGQLLERNMAEKRVECSTQEPALAVAALEAALGSSLQEFVGFVEDKYGRRIWPPRNGNTEPRAVTAPSK
ncbi:MAG: hypothetical protein CSA62_08800 [Planctomycetota bacterium]|nr:MAG: hypothetical protein CSA62_08800 [Planctomycetota bacterium]